MNVVSNDKLPPSFPLIKIKGSKYHEPIHQLVPILNLRHSVFDKLRALPEIIDAIHAGVRNMFSDEDKEILKEIRHDNRINQASKKFIEDIIHKNLVKYKVKSLILKLTNEITRLADLEVKHPQKTYKTYTKWFGFAGSDDITNRKIETITNDKLYMPFPIDFNDRFDCQLHLTEEDMFILGERNPNNLNAVKHLLLVVKYLLTISSFSLHHANSTFSNHMWGLYGSSGAGIAITYSLDELISMIRMFNTKLDPNDALFFDVVTYEEKYNPVEPFKVCLYDYYRDGKAQGALLKFLQKFALTKSQEWQFEKELRFYRFSFAVLSEWISKNNNYKSDITEQLCIELEQFLSENINKIKHEIDFNKPKQITLGWGCDTNPEHIKKLLEYAKINSIEVVKLDVNVNYSENTFYSNLV